MRVPEISPTARYGESYSPVDDSVRSINSVGSIRGSGVSKNGNFDYVSASLYGQRTHVSTAEEFVQKALNSLSSESPFTVQDLTHNVNSAQHITDTEDLREETISNANTYKSFKDFFNVDSPCLEDIENNVDTLGRSVGDSNLNSTSDINSLSKNDGGLVEMHSHEFVISAVTTSNLPNNAGQTQNNNFDFKNTFKERCFDNEADLLNQNNYQDHWEISRFNPQAAPSYDNDGRDKYLVSPTFSSGSRSAPKHSYFPRGIINPNYPGFQHLAHTLSEHFIEGLPSDSCDSDVSEYEMELSTDSCDDLPAEPNVNVVSYNNNNEQKTINDDTQKSISNMSCDKISKPTQNSFCDANCNTSTKALERGFLDLPRNLKTTLTLLEPRAYNSENGLGGREKVCSNMHPSGLITPDILLKDNIHCSESLQNKEDRPDLLRGVSPLFSSMDANQRMNTPVHRGYGFEAADLRTSVPRKDTAKDEVSFGLTPVDIIGDFEQEVEREFGLLVSGYKRLEDDHAVVSQTHLKDISDAALSGGKEKIGSKKVQSKYNQRMHDEISHINCCRVDPANLSNFGKDWCCHDNGDGSNTYGQSNQPILVDQEKSGMQKIKYQKCSYDDRQLPPVAIDYKRCQPPLRPPRNSYVGKSAKVSRNSQKLSVSNRPLHGKRGNITTTHCRNEKAQKDFNRKREEAELHQYQQLISDKEFILSHSKYAKLSSWAQYLKNSVSDGSSNNSDLISPSALELFDAYKIGTEIDLETLQKHMKMAKEIEKKRKNDREEIRRRLAIGAEETRCEKYEGWETYSQFRMKNGTNVRCLSEAFSDTESHSSDSETCPKLSRSSQNNCEVLNMSSADKPHNMRSLSSNCLHKKPEGKEHQELKRSPFAITNDTEESDFFTKQAKLQIEARMALMQAKEMAHMQMQFERQNQRISPITDIIRSSMEKVGVYLATDKRRVSRQMLTEMNLAQLQILVNNLHTHIEGLNETLVHFLMERDDLHMGQDSMLIDIEELTRFLSKKEKNVQAADCLRQ